jgi:hypothetical protein
MEVVCDGAKRYAPECVVLVMTIMREPCNQGSTDKCYRNHLQAFIVLLQRFQNTSQSVRVRLNYFSIY